MPTTHDNSTGSPSWLSVEEQLAQSGIASGTALEKLVRENQDFHLLRPEEAEDDFGIPPWLRVYWRKQHPDVQYSGSYPAGIYPEALDRLLEWMLLHQNLPSGSPTDPTAK